MVGYVNGRHGTANWQPVRYLYRGVPREELVAYYRAADVCLVNPLRDGMNLVAMEFVACQEEGEGVLVLSELTGAAQTLGDGALQINPFAIHETAEVLARALSMDPDEKRQRMRRLFARVAACDVHGWLERILRAALEQEEVGLGDGHEETDAEDGEDEAAAGQPAAVALEIATAAAQHPSETRVRDGATARRQRALGRAARRPGALH